MLTYTMLTFSVRTNLATVGHVTFVPYHLKFSAVLNSDIRILDDIDSYYMDPYCNKCKKTLTV